MRLTEKQISKIDTKISFAEDKRIVEIDVSNIKDGWREDESNYNIYCIDKAYNVIWQVTEPYSKPIAFEGEPPDDPFYYLGQNESGEILADRFSGFEYKIDPETGVAKRIGFHK